MSRDDLCTSGDPTVIRRLERRLDIVTAAFTMFLLGRLTAEQLDVAVRRAAAELRGANVPLERALHLVQAAVVNPRLLEFDRSLRLSDDESGMPRTARVRIARTVAAEYSTATRDEVTVSRAIVAPDGTRARNR